MANSTPGLVPTVWIPHGLFQEASTGATPMTTVPMSAWPSVAWRIAKSDIEGIVAHSVLCLTLCVLGTRTNDVVLVAEASRHYALVLQNFQAQVSLLGRSGYSQSSDSHVASLFAAGFCCSQVEYMLDSWSSGDQHLQGMESLLQACGPSCLANSDIRRIFFDHCLLWLSCSVVHRRPTIYSWWHEDWTDIASECESAQDLVMIAARIPPLLQEYDALREPETAEVRLGLFQRLSWAITDLKALAVQNESHGSPRSLELRKKMHATPGSRLNVDFLSNAVVTGYSAAFLIHATVAALTLVTPLEEDEPYCLSTMDLTTQDLKASCERQVAQLRALIDELADGRYGMITASPMLFFIDTAWIAYRTLMEYGGRDLSDVRPWFINIGEHVASTGYRPLRKHWLEG